MFLKFWIVKCLLCKHYKSVPKINWMLYNELSNIIHSWFYWFCNWMSTNTNKCSWYVICNSTRVTLPACMEHKTLFININLKGFSFKIKNLYKGWENWSLLQLEKAIKYFVAKIIWKILKKILSIFYWRSNKHL